MKRPNHNQSIQNNMPTTLIEQKPDFERKVQGNDKLAISELFVDTLQGESVTAGHPATFIRLQGCTLTCVFCDTLDVWPYGNEYSFNEVLDLLEPHQHKYKNGKQHIILTGGSPIKQQSQLVRFIEYFEIRFGFRPVIEVENEAVLLPSPSFENLVHTWNNSPKLENSGMKARARVKPQILSHMSGLNNSWFKFVISSWDDWSEIEKDFLPYIMKEQIILMPEGVTQQELNDKREMVADMAIKHNVRFSDRLHITIWNKRTGV